MSYGIIEYNEDGKPKCEICGRHFDRVITHVRQKHFITEREYKEQFGFDVKKGICSKESSERTSIKTLENYDKCITNNLIKNGEKSRFVKGDKGRTKDMVSEQTRKRLYDRLTSPPMTETLQEVGKKLGESGLGNIARWKSQTE